MTSNTDATLKYIRSIRNEHKRDYATQYAIWLQRSDEDRETVVEPVPHQLSYMAAQSVRMRLHALAKFPAPNILAG